MMISSIVLFTIASSAGMMVPVSNIPWQSWISIAYLVIFGSVISFIAYLYALQNLPMGIVSVYAYMNPIVAVLFGALLFNEKLSAFIAAGGIITLAGVYLVNESFRSGMIKKVVDKKSGTTDTEQALKEVLAEEPAK